MANEARTAADLERKYNFPALLGMSKNIKMYEHSIVKVENELANMLNTLIINLADVFDNQSEISLWFFSGEPSDDEIYLLTENEEYLITEDGDQIIEENLIKADIRRYLL